MSEVGEVFRVNNDVVKYTLFTEVLRTFENAETFCENLDEGSSLARISNRAEFDLVEEVIIESQTSERIWIGNSLNHNCSIWFVFF